MARKTVLSKRTSSHSTPWIESSRTRGLRYKLKSTVTQTISCDEEDAAALAGLVGAEA